MQVIEAIQVGSGREARRRASGIEDLLTSCDRQLLHIWSSGAVSRRALAGVLQCSPGTVSRRVRRLRNRMNDGMVRMIARHSDALPADHRQIAIRILVRGERRNLVARQLALSRAELRRILAEIRGWARARALIDQQSV